MNLVRHIESFDGTRIALYGGSKIQPEAVVLVAHGYAEHMGRYTHVFKFFEAHQITLYGLDFRGHGHSGGERAYIESVDDLCRDMLLILEEVTSMHPSVPVFLLGHSHGGLVSLKTHLDHKPSIAGMILSGPALHIPDDLSPTLRKLAPILASLFPRLKTSKLDTGLVSRDPKVVQDYRADPLVYKQGMKARYAAASLSAIAETKGRYGELDLPLLVLHGEEDKLCDPRGSQSLVQECSSTDATLHILPGLYHEILNEPEQAEVLGLITTWIRERSGK